MLFLMILIPFLLQSPKYDINKFNHRCLGPVVVACDCYMEWMPWVQFYLVTKKEKQIDRCACDYGKGI